MDAEHLREIEKQLRVRVKTGCKTCRKRRIKCDERKPKCFRCLKSSRKCEGYEDTVADGKSPAARAALHRNPAFLVIPQAIPRGKTPVLASKPRNEPLSAIKILRNPNLTVFSDPEEARAFEFFRDRTSCAPSELFDSEFWGRRVLQLAYLEPAIKHGLLALSSLHESCEKLATFRGALWSEFALSQYSKAIHHSNVLMNTDGHNRDQIERILVSCILFTHYENLVGNYRLASMHLQNGMAILSQSEFWKEVRNIESPISTSQADDAAHLVAIFALLDLQASAFADCSAPYELSATQPAVAIVPPSFNSVAAARNCLLEIVRQLVQCLILFEGSPPGGGEFGERDSILFSARHALLLSALDEWPSAVDGLEEMYAARSSIKPCVAPAITLLRVYHRSTVIYTECAFSEDELSWDRHVDTFREMVDTIAAVSGYSCSDYPSSVESFKDPRQPPKYTPTTKTVHTMTLWTVATRCRDPFIRRQAIALMLVERRREGVWDSIGAARVAAEIVKVEEGLTGDLQLKKVESGIQHAGQVYLENRVRAVLSEVDMPRGGMRVRLWMTGQERAFRGPVWVSLEEA